MARGARHQFDAGVSGARCVEHGSQSLRHVSPIRPGTASDVGWKGLVEMEVIVERCASVHRGAVRACARTPDGHRGRREELVEFATTTSQLLASADWLAERRVRLVGKSDWRLLEAGALGARSPGPRGVGDQRPAHTQRPGPQDRRRRRGRWGASLLEHGLVLASRSGPASRRSPSYPASLPESKPPTATRTESPRRARVVARSA
jgi:hypothetical protein